MCVYIYIYTYLYLHDSEKIPDESLLAQLQV